MKVENYEKLGMIKSSMRRRIRDRTILRDDSKAEEERQRYMKNHYLRVIKC